MSANGYLTPAELASIGNGLFLRVDAAKSFLAMAAVAEADGVQINWPGIASAYRPWAMQVDMRVHPALYGINPNMHALPGLPSRHGTGLCRDVPFGTPNDWMIANAGRFPWIRPARTLKLNDLNHWEFTPGTTASLDISPITLESESDMKIISVPNSTIAKVGEFSGEFYTTTSGGQGFSIGANKKVYGEVGGLTNDEVTTLVNEANARGAAQAAKTAALVVASLSHTAGAASAQEIATALAPLIVPSIVARMGTELTTAQVQAATEAAMRAVFADAATK